MKRLMCLVLTVIMVISTITPGLAATIAETTYYVPNPMEMSLGLSVGVRRSGYAGSYEPSLAISTQAGSVEGVDYQANLDMSPIRALFDEGFMQTTFVTDSEAQAEFNAATVTSEIIATISYPSTAVFGNADLSSSAVGVLDAGTIFRETKREVENNKVKITFDNSKEGELTAQELMANKDTFLKDISFTLDGVVGYSTEGTHTVSVTLSGSTTIAFASKTQVVNYVGGASNIITITKEEQLPANMCLLEVVPAKPATCTEDGWSESVWCATHRSYDCDSTYGVVGIVRQTTIPKLNHMLGTTLLKVFIPYVEPTCASMGMKEHYTCALCKDDFDAADNTVKVEHEGLILPVSATHTGLTALPAVGVTCTTDGWSEGERCMDCGRITRPQIKTPATGHQNKIPVGAASAATCTNEGITAGEKCDDCGTILTPQEIIPATGHNFGAWVVITSPTEFEEGLQERTCQNGCATKESLPIPKLAHTHAINSGMAVITVQPTCTTGGKMQNYCACGEPMGAEVDIPADGHYTVLIAAVPATCVTMGKVEHYKCLICQQTFRDAQGTKSLTDPNTPVDRTNHGAANIVDIPAIAATCQRLGVTAGKKCQNCDVITVAPTVNRTAGYANHEYTWFEKVSATCGKTGVDAHWHCAICDEDFIEENGQKVHIDHEELLIPALEHIYATETIREATPQQDGDSRRYCTQPGCDYEKHFTIPYEKPNHKEIIDDITVHETCTTSGLKNRIYSCCGEVLERNIVIPPHPHTPQLVPVEYPTCHKEGVGSYYKCLECGKMFANSDMTEEIDAPQVTEKLEHEWYIHNDNPAQTIKKCRHCNEVIHIKKENNARVSNHGGIKEEKNIIHEDAAEEGVVQDVAIVSEINLTERTDISPELDLAIPDDAAEEKVVIEVEVERITTYYEGTTEIDKDIEPVEETEDLISFEIDIPTALQGKVRYEVWRRHGNVNEKLTTIPNAHGEYIEIDVPSSGIITVHASRFSEYAVVGFDTAAPVVGGGSLGIANVTIKFNANGGTVVEDKTVAVGTVITAPVTTREGYTFEGWYTDTSFNRKYDFTQPVRSNMTLYAKWVEGSGTGIGGEGDKIILILGDNTINVFGTDIEHDVPPVAVDNRTMLPIRIIAENLGATVDWNPDNQTATITGNGVEIKIAVGDNLAYVNGEPFSLDVAAFADNNRIYLPVRFVSEFLGAKVEWFGAEQKVVITRYGRNEMVLTIGERPAYVFGTIIVNDVAPVAVNNRTMLPIRFVVENLGGTVDWNAETQTVTINKDGINIRITIGDNTAYVNDEPVELDVAAFAENNRTYLPLRFVAEKLNANVEWVPETKSVVITKKY